MTILLFLSLVLQRTSKVLFTLLNRLQFGKKCQENPFVPLTISKLDFYAKTDFFVQTCLTFYAFQIFLNYLFYNGLLKSPMSSIFFAVLQKYHVLYSLTSDWGTTSFPNHGLSNQLLSDQPFPDH